jgi:hypothetical protein
MPRFASSRAKTSPIPDEAHVMSAILPVYIYIIISPLFLLL